MRAGASSVRLAGALAVLLSAGLGACGDDAAAPTVTPGAVHLALPAVAEGGAALAVLVSVPPTAGPADYTVTLVGTSGRTSTSVRSTRRRIDESGDTCVVARLPAVSSSAHRVFFLAGDNQLRYLDPDGASGAVRALSDPGTEIGFAVSPDEARVAVVAITATATAFHEVLRVERLDGASSTTIATHDVAADGTGRISWPVGWLGGALVLAEGTPIPQSSCHALAQPLGYSVVDATTGATRAHLCTSAPDAVPAGAPLSTGVLCAGHDTGARPVQALETIETWNGPAQPLRRALCGFTGALQPGGTAVAAAVDLPSGGGCGPGDGHVHLIDGAGRDTTTAAAGTPLGWIDADHLLVAAAGGLAVVTPGGGAALPVAAGGDLQGTLPPSLR